MVKYGRPADLAGREQGHDVRMLQLGRELDLAAEPVDADARRQLGQQHLDHDVPAQRGLDRQEDPRHPAAAELALEAVGLAQRLLELLTKIGGHETRPLGRSQFSTPGQGREPIRGR